MKTLLLLLTVALPPLIAGEAHAEERVAFLSSIQGRGDFSGWPGAQGAVGLAAADNVCQNLASEAGLEGTFVAWLSDSNDDAWCRVHGLTGRVGDAMPCGEEALPTSAGPWMRVDGKPFADRIDLMGFPNNRVYNPLWVDETGEVWPFELVWTGTDSRFIAHPGDRDCEEWTSASTAIDGYVGRSDSTAARFTLWAAPECSDFLPVYCFEVGAGDPLPQPRQIARRMFLTSVGGPGDLSLWPEAGGAVGIAAGDAICRDLAAQAGMGEADSFKAWLSDDSVFAGDRLMTDGPVARLDGVVVAQNNAGMPFGLESSVHLTELHEYVNGADVWTGTWIPQANELHCEGWTTTKGFATAGDAVTTQSWSSGGGEACSDTDPRLYCIAEVETLFWDGFEWGSISAWWSAAP